MTLQMRVLAAITIILAVVAGAIASQSAASQAAGAAGGKARTFFAFEREVWMEAPGAELVLQQLKRHGANPVLRRGEGEAPDSHRVCSQSVLPDGDRLRSWYGALRKGAPYWEHYVAYAESRDGVNWTRPSLNVAKPGTNLVIEGAGALTVVPDESGDGYYGAAQFWRADVGKPGAEPGATFQFVRSKDGYHWDFDATPALDVRHFEIYGMFRRDGQWWVLGQGVSPYFYLPDGGFHRRVMYGFHSPDGKQFRLYPRPFFRYEANPYFPDADLQNHVGAGIWDRGRLLIGLVGQFWPGGFSATVRATFGLIYSYDGIKWTEPFPRTPLLMPGPEGAWDGGMLFQIQRPVSRGDTTYVYYTGGDSGNLWATQEELGLTTVRRDGLAAWVARSEPAVLITTPLELLPGESDLYLNAKGPVSVRLLDKYLRPQSEALKLETDSVRAKALNLRALNPSGSFRLAFELAPGAELYTFTLGPDESSLPPLDRWE